MKNLLPRRRARSHWRSMRVRPTNRFLTLRRSGRARPTRARRSGRVLLSSAPPDVSPGSIRSMVRIILWIPLPR